MPIPVSPIYISNFLALPVAKYRSTALMTMLLAPLVGCSVTPAVAKEPLASREIQVVPGTTTLRLLTCVEKTVLMLSKTQNNWDDRITLKDLSSGRMETGNFPEKNVMGFRVSVHYAANTASARVRLKGAGPYFVDLGVDAAMAAFVQQTTACLTSP